MPSPFPGMNPYLENPAHWPDFHDSFLLYWRDWLADHLPDNYSVRITQRLTLYQGAEREDFVADVAVSQRFPLPERATEGGVAVAELAEPVTLPLLYLSQEKQSYLTILHRPDRTLITVLELLSPSNKRGVGRTEYLSQRDAQIRDTVHLVELDLLLGGQRLPFAVPLPEADYYAFVSRGDQRPNCEAYRWWLRQPLPRIPIPLKPPDADVILDLPGLFAQAYERGRYARELAYANPPTASVREGDLAWVKEIVRQPRP